MSVGQRLLGRGKKVLHAGLDSLYARRNLGRWKTVSDGLVIMGYHRILPADSSEIGLVEPGMYVSTETFQRHLEFLCGHFEPVDLKDWLDRRNNRRSLPQRAFAVTFDDGWLDNYQFAFPILQKLGVPATIFVVSGLAGTRYSFWPERLARLLGRISSRLDCEDPWLKGLVDRAGLGNTEVSEETISRVIACAKQYSDESIQQQMDRLEQLYDVQDCAERRDLFNWQELRDMIDSGLVAPGSHTRHHVRLRESVAIDVMRDEITNSKLEIEQNTGFKPKLFCYPNGDLSPSAESLVRKEYDGACTISRGWNSAAADAHRLQRILVHNDRSRTEDALVARIGYPA